jgi:hypothetical protein
MPKADDGLSFEEFKHQVFNSLGLELRREDVMIQEGQWKLRRSEPGRPSVLSANAASDEVERAK